MRTLENICMDIADFEGKLMYGEVNFTYDRLLTVMGAGHPAEMLDKILAPVFWPVMNDKDVPTSEILKLYKNIIEFKNSFNIKELSPIIAELKEYLALNGEDVTPQKVTIKDLKKQFVGKTLDMKKFIAAGDVWNAGVDSGVAYGHFYWNNEHHRFCDEFSILVDDSQVILDINPLETSTVDNGDVNSCRYTLVHNGEFKRLLAAGTEK